MSRDVASVTFLATIAPLQSGIQITGDKAGMRLKIDVPESEMANALTLLVWRERVLEITVRPQNERDDTPNRTELHL
jgi:hypothetical protein